MTKILPPLADWYHRYRDFYCWNELKIVSRWIDYETVDLTFGMVNLFFLPVGMSVACLHQYSGSWQLSLKHVLAVSNTANIKKWRILDSIYWRMFQLLCKIRLSDIRPASLTNLKIRLALFERPLQATKSAYKLYELG